MFKRNDKKRKTQTTAQPVPPPGVLPHQTRNDGYLETQGMIAEVMQIRQIADTGQKCWIRFPNWNNAICAAWLPGYWPSIGQFITIQGAYGQGEHHGEFMLYANRTDQHR